MVSVIGRKKRLIGLILRLRLRGDLEVDSGRVLALWVLRTATIEPELERVVVLGLIEAHAYPALEHYCLFFEVGTTQEVMGFRLVATFCCNPDLSRGW